MGFTKEFNFLMKTMPKDKKTALIGKVDLTDRQMEIFNLRYRKGCSMDFIADQLNLSYHTIKYDITKIKDKIKEVL